MRSISLFSGCGGFDFAARSLGVDTVLANDILGTAADSFKRSFPEVDFRLGDIAAIKKFPSVEIITGGYPCQSFSMGGKRDPKSDPRSTLFEHFARAVDLVNPKYFIAENVSGLRSVDGGRWLNTQLETFAHAGAQGYNVRHALLDACDFGVPQRRRRIFLVGVRKDLEQEYVFPRATHGAGLMDYSSHGQTIAHLPEDPKGEYYERPHDSAGNFSWYYMSRNRRAAWVGPSYTIVANARHVTLHPASPIMELVSSNLADGWKQKWEFSDRHEESVSQAGYRPLSTPRRLSWREAALIQTFPDGFEPAGNISQKYLQIGNAVPPLLAKAVMKGIVDGTALAPIVA